MIELNKEEKIVIEIIKTRDRFHKIFDSQIRYAVSITDPSEKQGAGLRRVINSLRQKGYPICSDTGGYWYASSKEELIENVEALKGRAIKILEAARGMEKAAEGYDEMQRLL